MNAGVLGVELRRVQLDLRRPHRAAHGTTTVREVIVVKVTDGHGNVGWGECSALARPDYTAEYLDGCWQVLTTVVIPDVLGAAPGDVLGALAGVVGHPMARAGLVTALLDLDLRARGASLRTALADGAPARAAVPSCAVVPLTDSVDELVDAVAEARDAGFAHVKLKIAPGRDLARIRAVRSVWPELSLAADANGSFADAGAAEERLGGARGVGSLGLDYLEQPLAADDLVGAAVLARRLGVPIALDESIESIGDTSSALALGAMQVVNVKPARVGGPLAAAAIAQVAAGQGCAVFCGGMLESGIGRAAAAAFAAQAVCTLPTDLGPSARYFSRDLATPLALVDGHLQLPEGAGIGVEVDETLLAAATVQRWERAR